MGVDNEKQQEVPEGSDSLSPTPTLFPEEIATAQALLQAEAGQHAGALQQFVDDLVARIPAADQVVTREQQTDAIVGLLMSVEEKGSHLFSTLDKFGNLPPALVQAQEQGKEALAAQLREYADHPESFAPKTDKLNAIAQSGLPETVQAALVSAIMKIGEHCAARILRDAADALERPDADVAGVLEHARQQALSQEVRESDERRQEVFRQLLTALYPDIVSSARMQEARAARAKEPESQNRGASQEREERREAKQLSDITWIHVEDNVMIIRSLQRQLGGDLEMQASVGTAQSVEAADALLHSLASKKQELDLVILDKSFPFYENETGDSGAWEEFMNRLEQKAADPNTQDFFKHTKVMIMSGDISHGTLLEMQERYPRIIGALEKGRQDTSLVLAGTLAEQGVVKAEGKAHEAQSYIQRKNALRALDVNITWSFLQRIANEESAARQEALAMVNKARAQLQFDLLTDDSEQFGKILQALKRKADDFYAPLSADDIFG